MIVKIFIKSFLNSSIKWYGIPFEIKKLKLNKETIQAIEEVIKGINVSKGYTNLDSMWKKSRKRGRLKNVNSHIQNDWLLIYVINENIIEMCLKRKENSSFIF